MIRPGGPREWLVAAGLALAACATPQPDETTTVSIAIYDWGVYEPAGDLARDEDFRAVDPDRLWFRLLEQSGEVDCRIGTAFGVRFHMGASGDASRIAAYRVVWEHPFLDRREYGIFGTATERTFQAEFVPGRSVLQREVWTIDTPADQVPGAYAVSVFVEGEPALRREFELEGCPTAAATGGG